MSARLLLATAAIATTFLACSGAGQGDLRDSIEQTTPTTSQSSAAATSDAGALVPGPTVGSAGRPADQFKTSAQLRAAIATCLGSGVTAVTAAMVQTTTGASVTGFLSPASFAAGDDVIAQQVLVFDGDPEVARTGVRNDTVSLPLLAALQNVGNVVGGNCAASLSSAVDAGAATSMCACSTHDTALAMLTRCLPSVDPSAYASVVDGFAAACSADDAAAIASLVASTTFGAQ